MYEEKKEHSMSVPPAGGNTPAPPSGKPLPKRDPKLEKLIVDVITLVGPYFNNVVHSEKKATPKYTNKFPQQDHAPQTIPSQIQTYTQSLEASSRNIKMIPPEVYRK